MVKLDVIKTEIEFNNLRRLLNKGHRYSIFSNWEWMFGYWKYLKIANDELAIFVFWISENQWIIFPLKTNAKDLNKKLEFICSSKTDYNYPIEYIDKLSSITHTRSAKRRRTSVCSPSFSVNIKIP